MLLQLLHDRNDPKALIQASSARVLLALSIAGCIPSVSAQTLPPGAGLRIGDGTSSTLGPRRGVGEWVTETSFTAQATLTNNANYGTSDTRQGDLILEFIPALRFNREGGRLKVDGYVALDFVGYAEGSQVNSILPNANILANLEAIDNLFFVDASLYASQSVLNPFLASSQSSTNNIYTTTNARVAPYLTGNFGPNVRWLVRSDNSYSWSTDPDNSLGAGSYTRNLAEIVQTPLPFGVTVRLTNDLTRQNNQIQPDQTLKTALAIFNYAFTPQFTFGLRGGYESTNYTAEEITGPVYGANLSWQPSPLSSVVGYWEDRFYGPSYQFLASHRHRRVASSASFYRTISTYPQLLFQIPATNTVTGLLDAILRGRFADPVERAKAAEELVALQGLPEALPAGAYIYSQNANILTGGNFNWALLGVRNALSFGLFYLKTQTLPDARVPPTFLVLENNIQQGGGVTLSHILTPVISLNASVTTSYTRGFGPSEGLNSRQNLAKLQANWRLSPRSTLFMGTFYDYTTANTAAAGSNNSEAAAYVGLFHRL